MLAKGSIKLRSDGGCQTQEKVDKVGSVTFLEHEKLVVNTRVDTIDSDPVPRKKRGTREDTYLLARMCAYFHTLFSARGPTKRV